MANQGFQVIGSEASPPPSPGIERDTKLLMLAISTISKRFVIAISNLFTLVALGSVWLLTYKVLPNPTNIQLIGVGGYALFILILEAIRRRTNNAL